jgi:Skp family chaperone for outer membrane proteins
MVNVVAQQQGYSLDLTSQSLIAAKPKKFDSSQQVQGALEQRLTGHSPLRSAQHHAEK